MPTMWLGSSDSITATVGETIYLTAYMDPSDLSSSISAYGAKIRYDGDVHGSNSSWEEDSNGTWYTEIEYEFSSAGTYSVSVGLTNKSGTYLGYSTGSIKVYIEDEYEPPDVYIDEDLSWSTTDTINVYCVVTEGYSSDNYEYYVIFSLVKVSGGDPRSHDSDTFSFPSSGKKTLSYNFTGLEAGTVYRATVEVVRDDTGDYVAVDSIELPTGDPIRPDDWEWVSTVEYLSPVPTNKVAGTENDYAATFLTKEEWYDFITRIEEFATYLRVDFTVTDRTNCTRDVLSGYPMKASQLNGARSFILKLNPPKSPPAAVQPGGLVTAAFVNGLKDSLNSIK